MLQQAEEEAGIKELCFFRQDLLHASNISSKLYRVQSLALSPGALYASKQTDMPGAGGEVSSGRSRTANALSWAAGVSLRVKFLSPAQERHGASWLCPPLLPSLKRCPLLSLPNYFAFKVILF